MTWLAPIQTHDLGRPLAALAAGSHAGGAPDVQDRAIRPLPWSGRLDILAVMTRLLVVHPNPLVLWDRAVALEHAGYDVATCPGPSTTDCPVLKENACPLLDHADALIYDAALGPDRDVQFLAERLRETYADLPLILVGAGGVAEAAPVGEGAERVWSIPDVGSVAQLTAVVEEALAEQGMAV